MLVFSGLENGGHPSWTRGLGGKVPLCRAAGECMGCERTAITLQLILL